MIPGLNLGLPPLQFSSGANIGQEGAAFSASNGDWSVNLAGSGTALQTSASGLNWLLIAAAVGALWWFNRK